jgi:CBS domain-containing protein
LRPYPASTIDFNGTLGEAKKILLEASLNILVVTDLKGESVLGVFTLHDLIRSQLTVMECDEGDQGVIS